jgi:hypothetical protein
MRQDIEIKFFLGPNTFLFPEVIITETIKLDFLQNILHFHKWKERKTKFYEMTKQCKKCSKWK